jgi:hypothetical protein
LSLILRARPRRRTEAQLQTNPRTVNFFRLWHPGKPRVNVELNLALDATHPRK